jgi:hypothetical protein
LGGVERLMLRAGLLVVLLALCSVSSASGGAWTLPKGDVQIIVGTAVSNANVAFDGKSRAITPTVFSKTLVQLFAQYGLTDKLTLFLDPEYATALSGPGGLPATRARDAAIGGGVRYGLTDSIGIVSLEASVKSAGAFNLSVSKNGVSGQQAELRLLYGTNFRWLNRDGFVDVEAAERLISGRQPNETPIDITIGWHVTPKWMAMVQNFNIVSGSAQTPFGYYRTHKLQLSAVYQVSPHIAIQNAVFFSPAGQNALQERGIVLSVWANF